MSEQLGGRYRLGASIGSGAMGEVHLAEDTTTRARVVVKIMHAGLGAALQDRLRLEAQALAALKNDYIVRVLDWGMTGEGRPYLVMEHLLGRPFDQVLRERAPLPLEEALDLGCQMLAALDAVHERGMVHRDVKPSNLFLCDSGRLKLLDFGVIKLVEAVTGVVPLVVGTKAGMVVGTPKYMAPEQALGRRIDARADQYAAGLVVYAMLTGTTPFEGHRELEQLVRAHAKEIPRAPSELSPVALPAGLDDVVLRALAKDPDDRHTDVMVFAGRLFRFHSSYARVMGELGVEGADRAPVAGTTAGRAAADEMTMFPEDGSAKADAGSARGAEPVRGFAAAWAIGHARPFFFLGLGLAITLLLAADVALQKLGW